MKAHLKVALTTMLATSTPAVSQETGPCPSIYPQPTVGEYAELRLDSPNQGHMVVRFAIVGEEEIEGRNYFWFEVASTPPDVGGPVIAQMLVPHYPFEREEIESYVVQLPGQNPVRVPREMMSQLMESGAAPAPGWREQCAAARELGRERVSVAAGTFDARHLRSGDAGAAEMWIADVPFGIVKMTSPDGTMELLAHGSDARSSLTGEPRDLEPQSPGGG